MVTVNGRDIEPGCYVDGHKGIYAPECLSDLLSDLGVTLTDPFPGVDDEFVYEWCDYALEKLNAVTAAPYSWEWSDGEIFLMDEEWWQQV